jgi:two-component sensor histidine kinase
MLTAQEIGEDKLELREANHRMMNVLATLQAVFRRKFSQFGDQRVRSAAAQFESQIIAASELLQAISSTSSAKDAAVDVYLERLGRALSRAILSPANIGCEVFSDQGRLPLEVCERLGFILVELVVNASKYAFADQDNGVVRIAMTRSGRHWRCMVSDNGIGMNGAGRGTGLNIVDALVRSLKGRLIIRSGASGTGVCVVLPAHSIPRRHGSAQDAIVAAEFRGRPANWRDKPSCVITTAC